jgi:hypothetical protein
MKKTILIITLLFIELSASSHIQKLPIETVKFIDSFSCFNTEDKNTLLLYALNNELMIENHDDRDFLQSNTITHRALFDQLLNVERKCMLNDLYKHIERSMTLTPSRERNYKRAKQAMDRGPYAETTSSDKALIQREIKSFNSKIITFLQTNSGVYLDISSIKNHQTNSIPKETMHFIKSIKEITEHERKLLLYYANNTENRLRSYDNPEVQKKLIKEEVILNECLRNTSYKLAPFTKTFLHDYHGGGGSFSYNTEKLPQSFIRLYSTLTPVRKATANLVDLNYDHGGTRLSMSELDTLCSKFNPPVLNTFDQGFNKEKKERKKLAVNLLLKNIDYKSFSENALVNKRLKRYVNLSYLIAEDESLAFSFGLEHDQLEKCLKDSIEMKQFDLFTDQLNDSLEQDKKYRSYKKNLHKGIRWWMQTLVLKAKTEGIGSFFDNSCDALTATEIKMERNKKKQYRISDAVIKGHIFNGYDKVIQKENLTHINNQIALEKRMIFPAWMKKNKIYSTNGGEITLSTTLDNRLKVTFADYPSGEECVELMLINNIYSDTGLIAIVDGKNISLSDHEKVKEICNSFDQKDISFVKK